MGLHQTVNHGWKKALLWYQSVNSRGGRWHLWEIPIYQYDKTALNAAQEQSFRYGREELVNRYDAMTWAEFLEENPPQGARRMCNMRQEVYRWSRRWSWSVRATPTPNDRPPRGWCARCWPIYLEKVRQIQHDSEHTTMWANGRLRSNMELRWNAEAWQEQVDGR